MVGGSLVCSGVSVAEHEMTTRATTANTIQIDFIRDSEAKCIVQICTAIRELNVMRWWHGRTEAIAIPFPSLVFEKVSQTGGRPRTEIPEEKQSGDEEVGWEWEVKVAPST
jgi:hypothetical protein